MDGNDQPSGKMIFFFEKCVGELKKSRMGVDKADQTFALNASF
jgi:hypothetical protein